MKTLIAFLVLASTALAVEPYPIVAVRLPFTDGVPGIWPNADQPTLHPTDAAGNALWDQYQRGGDLVLIKPDGTEEVLIDSGDGTILDPNIDGKGEWCYYAKAQGAFQGYDIYKVNLATKEEIRLTNHEWNPPRSIAYGATWNVGTVKGHAPSNICPVVIGDRVIFCSNRDSLRTNGNRRGSDQCFLIYAMDTDGKNVERIGAWHLGSALHPEKHPSGRIMFSTNEKMGYRFTLGWGIWAYWPDGSAFEPFMSAYHPTSGLTMHGHSALADGRVAFVHYYPPRNGTGTILAANPFPTGSPAAPPRFLYPPGPQGEYEYVGEPAAWMGLGNSGKVVGESNRILLQQNFLTAGSIGLTRFAHPDDNFPMVLDGVRQGFCAFPSAAPNGLLLTWTGSEAIPNETLNSAFRGRGRIMRLADNLPVTRASGMVPVFENPAYSYIQPKAVIPDATLYGNEIPTRPWIANDGSKCPAYLPKGSPFGIVGSASTMGREWMKWAYGSTGGQIVDTTNDDLRYIRVYMTRPSPVGHVAFNALARERLDILCDIPIRKPREDSTEPTDGDGNPDTSWLAKIPGDTAFTLACLNSKKEQLVLARTWHGLRPGEVRVDCGGCHKHTKGGTAWETTLAFRKLSGNLLPDDPAFEVVDGTHARTIQMERDAQPTLTALGLVPSISDSSLEPAANNVHPGRALRSPLYTGLATATAEQKELLAAWIDSGAGRGAGMIVDDLRPILTVQEPGREQRTPITAIRFGAYDVHSGIATVSVKATFVVNGRGAGSELSDLFTTTDSVWSLVVPSQASGEVTVKVTDAAGNSDSLTRTLKIVNPNAARIAEINARLVELDALDAANAAERAALQTELMGLITP